MSTVAESADAVTFPTTTNDPVIEASPLNGNGGVEFNAWDAVTANDEDILYKDPVWICPGLICLAIIAISH